MFANRLTIATLQGDDMSVSCTQLVLLPPSDQKESVIAHLQNIFKENPHNYIIFIIFISIPVINVKKK